LGLLRLTIRISRFRKMPAGLGELPGGLGDLTRHVAWHVGGRLALTGRLGRPLRGLAQPLGGFLCRFGGLARVAAADLLCGLLHRLAGRLRGLLARPRPFRRLGLVERVSPQAACGFVELLRQPTGGIGKLFLPGLLRAATRFGRLRGLLERAGLCGLPLSQIAGLLAERLAGFAWSIAELFRRLLRRLGGSPGGPGSLRQPAVPGLLGGLQAFTGEFCSLRGRLRLRPGLAGCVERELSGLAGELLLGIGR
jgi:hypothetical protein